MNALIERNNQVDDENRRNWQLNRHNKDVRLYLTHEKIRHANFRVQKTWGSFNEANRYIFKIPAFNLSAIRKTDVEEISENLKYGWTSALSDPDRGGRRRSKAEEEDHRALYLSASERDRFRDGDSRVVFSHTSITKAGDSKFWWEL